MARIFRNLTFGCEKPTPKDRLNRSLERYVFNLEEPQVTYPAHPIPGRHRIGGGRGGKGGAMRGAKNGFGATPYFLVIANDQEG